MHVNAHGTLRIQGVQREDAGFLVCNALSVAGSNSVRAFLQVIVSCFPKGEKYSCFSPDCNPDHLKLV